MTESNSLGVGCVLYLDDGNEFWADGDEGLTDLVFRAGNIRRGRSIMGIASIACATAWTDGELDYEDKAVVLREWWRSEAAPAFPLHQFETTADARLWLSAMREACS